MQIKISSDDYRVIEVIKKNLNCDDTKAAAILFEIGLQSFINYPTGNLKIDAVLSEPKYLKIVEILKAIWEN